jgi:hypothetical protein
VAHVRGPIVVPPRRSGRGFLRILVCGTLVRCQEEATKKESLDSRERLWPSPSSLAFAPRPLGMGELVIRLHPQFIRSSNPDTEKLVSLGLGITHLPWLSAHCSRWQRHLHLQRGSRHYDPTPSGLRFPHDNCPHIQTMAHRRIVDRATHSLHGPCLGVKEPVSRSHPWSSEACIRKPLL